MTDSIFGTFLKRLFTAKVLAIYSIGIGFIISVTWIIIFITDKMPEGKYELFFHILSEFIMIYFSFLGGIMMIRKLNEGALLCLVAQSMIFYSTLNAIGYYVEHLNFLMLFILFLVLVLSFCAMISLYIIDDFSNHESKN